MSVDSVMLEPPSEPETAAYVSALPSAAVSDAEGAVASAATAGINPVGDAVSASELAVRSGALEQLQNMMDDSQMPIFISDDEDRYLYSAFHSLLCFKDTFGFTNPFLFQILQHCNAEAAGSRNVRCYWKN